MHKYFSKLTFLVTLFLGIVACTDDAIVYRCPYPPGTGKRREKVHQTSFFMASDRHESGDGNNLAPLLRITSKGAAVTPSAVLLDGDFVGGGGDRTPVFSVESVYNEIDSVLNTNSCEVLLGYGSHDANCSEGYAAFLSGPRRMEGYFVYGLSFAQMAFATDSAARAAILKSRQEAATSEDEGDVSPPPGGDPGYAGLDTLDRRGISAQSASGSFTEWVSSIPGDWPVVVMSHMPLHAIRKDNLGAETWVKALNEAGKSHPIIFIWAHNHTLEERAGRDGGEIPDRDNYLLLPGDNIQVQTCVDSISVQERLRFTYVNAGYLKLGYASVVTFSDSRGEGRFDHVRIERFTINEADTLNSTFGNTGRPNPFEFYISRSPGRR